MRGRTPWAIAGAALMIATASAASGAVTMTSTGWRTSHLYPAQSRVNDIAATAPDDAFAVGEQRNADGSPSKTPVIASRWTGSAWRTLPQPPAVKGYAPAQAGDVVAASSAGNAWVFTDTSRGTGSYMQAQRWNGSRWVSQFVFPASVVIYGAVTTGPGDVWAFGADFTTNPAGVPYAAHYNGASWARVPYSLLPTIVSPQLASALSASDIWAIGREPRSGFAVRHYTGGAWRKVPIPPVTVPPGDGYSASSILAESDSNVWATGFITRGPGGIVPGMVLLHYNGRGWTRIAVPDPVSVPITLAQDGTGGIWLTAGLSVTVRAYRYTSAGKLAARITIPHAPGTEVVPETSVWIPGTRSLWSAGVAGATTQGAASHGVILRYGP